jgi:arginase family enzyme
MNKLDTKHLIGFEIGEYNPSLDKDHRSMHYMLELLKALIAKVRYAD